MGTKNQAASDLVPPESKKKRRVGFAKSTKTDPGIEANGCLRIYLVSRKEEVDSEDSFVIEPVDLAPFFGDDGKIYGYKNLEVTVWISSISFHVYANISFESSSDGGKGITDLKSALMNIFGENLVENKEEFLNSFSSDRQYMKSVVSSGVAIEFAANGVNQVSDNNLKEKPSDFEVFRIVGEPVGRLYSRLVPLVLLLVDGSNPIDILDPRWEIYIVVQKTPQFHEDGCINLIGFAAVYRFHRYPESTRLRLGQILVLPPYQSKGHGSSLLKVLNKVAISEDVYDLTVEEPEDDLQHVRTRIDVQRLVAFNPIQDALSSVVLRVKSENLSKKSEVGHYGPPPSAIEEVRKSLKINKRHFSQCWEVLLYLGLNPIEKHEENFRTIISARIKADLIGKDSEGVGKQVMDVPTEYDGDTSFVMFKSNNCIAPETEMAENGSNKEDSLRQLVDERMKEVKSIAGKVSIAG